MMPMVRPGFPAGATPGAPVSLWLLKAIIFYYKRTSRFDQEWNVSADVSWSSPESQKASSTEERSGWPQHKRLHVDWLTCKPPSPKVSDVDDTDRDWIFKVICNLMFWFGAVNCDALCSGRFVIVSEAPWMWMSAPPLLPSPSVTIPPPFQPSKQPTNRPTSHSITSSALTPWPLK